MEFAGNQAILTSDEEKLLGLRGPLDLAETTILGLEAVLTVHQERINNYVADTHWTELCEERLQALAFQQRRRVDLVRQFTNAQVVHSFMAEFYRAEA